MNKVVHFEIPFVDGDRARNFYKEVFGWKMIELPEMNYTIVHTVETDQNNMPKEAGAINGGMLQKEETAKSPVLVIDVPFIDEHISKIEAAGGSLKEIKD